MNDREIFESKFTVPLGVIWADENNEYLPDDPFADKEEWDSMRRLAGQHNAKFEGYRAGRESLREELAAAKAMTNQGWDKYYELREWLANEKFPNLKHNCLTADGEKRR